MPTQHQDHPKRHPRWRHIIAALCAIVPGVAATAADPVALPRSVEALPAAARLEEGDARAALEISRAQLARRAELEAARLRLTAGSSANDPAAEDALAAIDGSIASLGPLPALYYLAGRAAAAVGDQTRDPAAYTDAAVYHVRALLASPNDALAAASMLELAYALEQLGDADQAEKWYNRARALIGRAGDPALRARWRMLRGAE